MQIAMIQGKMMPFEQFEPAYLDRGLYFGDGVYEVLRSYNGKIFALEEHIQRFANSLAAIEITSVDVSEIKLRVQKAYEAAAISNAKIYFHITRGSGPRNHSWDSNLKPNFFMTITELEDNPKLKTDGVAVSLYPDMRWKRCDIKSLNLLPNVLAHQDAKKKGCFEAILVNDAGLITEGSSSAFFEIFGKNLQTAPLSVNILPSVTRKFILKAAKNIGMGIIEKALTPQQAAAADELFLAVTTKDIIGIVKFDGKIIGDGKPGKYTKMLTEEFRSFTV